MLENGENVCWYCWIRKGEEYGKLVSKKNNPQQSRPGKVGPSISYELDVNNPGVNIQRNNNKTANDKPLGSLSALFGVNKKSNSVVKSIATPDKTLIQNNINTLNISNEKGRQVGNIPAQQKACTPINELSTPAKRPVPP